MIEAPNFVVFLTGKPKRKVQPAHWNGAESLKEAFASTFGSSLRPFSMAHRLLHTASLPCTNFVQGVCKEVAGMPLCERTGGFSIREPIQWSTIPLEEFVSSPTFTADLCFTPAYNGEKVSKVLSPSATDVRPPLYLFSIQASALSTHIAHGDSSISSCLSPTQPFREFNCLRRTTKRLRLLRIDSNKSSAISQIYSL